MKHYRHLYRTVTMIMACSLLGAPAAMAASASPILDGAAPAGITVNTDVNNNTVVTQAQGQSVATISWQDFSVGNGKTIDFQQAENNYIAINRVTSNIPSSILGTITANGNIFILNSNGITFGNNAVVDVGSLVASTANDVSLSTLPNGNDRYTFTGQNQNEIILNNNTEITVSDGGFAILAAPSIRNSGNITANQIGRAHV